MAFEFRLPDIGEGIAEAEIVEWLVKEGDEIKADEIILKIETDKAVADIPTPVSGKVLKINYAKGDTVNVGSVLCVIGSDGEKVKSSVKVTKEEVVEQKVERVLEKKESNFGKVLASPAVRRVAKEKKIELNSIMGSGLGGVIVLSDLPDNIKTLVESSVSKAIVETSRPAGITAVRKYDMFGYVERVPMKGVRKVIAQNMIRSLAQSAQVTSMEDIDVSKLWDLRKKEKEHFAIEGVKLTFMPLSILP